MSSDNQMPETAFLRFLQKTIHHGGCVYFIKEQATSVMRDFFADLKRNHLGEIPFAEKSVVDLANGHWRTQENDLILFGDLSRQQVSELAAKCLGILVKTGTQDIPQALFDAQWTHVVPPVARMMATGERPTDVRPVLFLDRDDVIVKNVPYNKDPSQVELFPGITELIRRAHQAGHLVIICSNQSGIGRGKIAGHEYVQVHARMMQLLAEEKAWVHDCYWADYIENSILPPQKLYPQLRKPRAGMFLQAAEKWPIDFATSMMVGDSASDLMAAYAAGVRCLYLIESAKANEEEFKLKDFQATFADMKYVRIKDYQKISF